MGSHMFCVTSKFCCSVSNTRVYVDSSSIELKKLLSAQPGHKLRGIITDDQLYVWSAFEIIHKQMVDYLIEDGEISAKEPTIAIRVVMNEGNLEIFVYGKDIDKAVHNKIVKAIINNNPGHNRIYEM